MASKEEKIQHILEHLGSIPQIDNNANVLNEKYPNDDPFDHLRIMEEMRALGLIEEIIALKKHLFRLTRFGVEVLNDGGYVEYEAKRKERQLEEDETRKQDLILVKKINKHFKVNMSIGLIGGFLGIITFALSFLPPKSTETPQSIPAEQLEKPLNPVESNSDTTSLTTNQSDSTSF